MPQHIVARIKKDFRDIFKFIEEHKKSPPPKGRPYRYLCDERYFQISYWKWLFKRLLRCAIIFQRFMRGDPQQREHLVRGRGEFLRINRDITDSKTRGDLEWSIRKFWRGFGEAQCTENQIFGRLLLLRKRCAHAEFATR